MLPNMTIGERLFQLRKEVLKISQEEMAKILKVESPSTISLLEKDKRQFTDRMVADICREFGVNEKWLRSGEGNMFSASEQSELAFLFGQRVRSMGETERAVLTAYLKMNTDQREALNTFIDTIISIRGH
jgi:transcriptional regulator with XRE-family HTH domain